MAELGIIAGGGSAPRLLAETCRRIGRPYFLVCLQGQADENLGDGQPHVWLPLGAASKLKAIASERGIDEVVMIGRVRRPSLLEIKPDWLALKVLTRIGMNALGDNALLTAIGKAIEVEGGVRVIGVQDVFKDLLMPAGCLGSVRPTEEAQADIRRGFQVATALGALDIGQSVVVQQGLVLGVEAIEGTDALIARCGLLRREGAGGVLVKTAKPQQDNRYDLPTVGVDTVTACAQAGLTGIVLEAGRGLLLERERVVAAADAAGIFLLGWQHE